MLKYLSILTLFLVQQTLQAQQNMILYQMHEIVQSNSLNPAVPADCGWVVGMPALGNLSLAVSTPISYKDLGAGETVLDATELLTKFKNKNIGSSNININTFFLGYRSENNYFQFSINQKIHLSALVPKSILDLGLKGNLDYVGENLDVKMDIQAMAYHEVAFSWTHHFGEDLWVGVRPKLLFGVMGMKTEHAQLNLYTHPNTYDLDINSDLLFQMSAPSTVEINPTTGKVAKIDVDWGRNLATTQNLGFGVDLGLIKENEEGWAYSFSLLNIGSIAWKHDNHTFFQKGQLNYSGPSSTINNWNDFADTLRNVIKLSHQKDQSFSQMLSPTVMLAASKPIHTYWRLGVTGMIVPIGASKPWALTATAFTQNTNIISLGASYTVTPYSFFNLGLGLGLRAGAFQFHLLSDNIVALFSPFTQRYTSLQMGINFKFGCGDRVKQSTIKAVPCPVYRNVHPTKR